MKKKNVVIYLPGLGDQMTFGQDLAIKFWRIFGLHCYYHKIGWTVNELYSGKLDRVLDRIDRLTSEDAKVTLVGVSAGASVAINAFSQRKETVHKVVLVCGKINNPGSIGPGIFKRNPTFKESLETLGRNLKTLSPKDRSKMMSIHPLRDSTVPVADTIIEGAKEKTIPVAGHKTGIAYTAVFGGRFIAKFINR